MKDTDLDNFDMDDLDLDLEDEDEDEEFFGYLAGDIAVFGPFTELFGEDLLDGFPF